MKHVEPGSRRSTPGVAAIAVVICMSGLLGCSDSDTSAAALERRKQAIAAEVDLVLVEIRMREEVVFNETAVYPSVGSEAVPPRVPRAPVTIGALPEPWKKLGAQLPDKLYCSYSIHTGRAGEPIPEDAKTRFRITEDVAAEWFISTAECDADLDSKINSHYMTASFRPFVSKVATGY